jgi:hypothetical protein
MLLETVNGLKLYQSFYGVRIDSITTIWREPEDSVYHACWAENVKGLFFVSKK